jgi:uncharacterized protein with HEPN domain
MRTVRSNEDRLLDIANWGDRLADHLKDMTRAQFMQNKMAQDAATKCAEVIGEAAGELARLEPNIETQYPDLRLSDANRSRNRLSHGYHSIDYGILWETATKSIPATVAAPKAALADRKTDDNDGGDGPGGSVKEGPK